VADNNTPQPHQPGHDTTVPYQDDIIPGDLIDVQHWDWWSETDGDIVHYYTKGPFPTCKADTQGHLAEMPAPIGGLGRTGTRHGKPPAHRTDAVEIPLRCLCGADHGHPGAGSCGRRWSLIGPGAA
jgi:hypothetical protein